MASNSRGSSPVVGSGAPARKRNTLLSSYYGLAASPAARTSPGAAHSPPLAQSIDQLDFALSGSIQARGGDADQDREHWSHEMPANDFYSEQLRIAREMIASKTVEQLTAIAASLQSSTRQSELGLHDAVHSSYASFLATSQLVADISAHCNAVAADKDGTLEAVAQISQRTQAVNARLAASREQVEHLEGARRCVLLLMLARRLPRYMELHARTGAHTLHAVLDKCALALQFLNRLAISHPAFESSLTAIHASVVRILGDLFEQLTAERVDADHDTDTNLELRSVCRIAADILVLAEALPESDRMRGYLTGETSDSDLMQEKVWSLPSAVVDAVYRRADRALTVALSSHSGNSEVFRGASAPESELVPELAMKLERALHVLRAFYSELRDFSEYCCARIRDPALRRQLGFELEVSEAESAAEIPVKKHGDLYNQEKGEPLLVRPQWFTVRVLEQVVSPARQRLRTLGASSLILQPQQLAALVSVIEGAKRSVVASANAVPLVQADRVAANDEALPGAFAETLIADLDGVLSEAYAQLFCALAARLLELVCDAASQCSFGSIFAGRRGGTSGSAAVNAWVRALDTFSEELESTLGSMWRCTSMLAEALDTYDAHDFVRSVQHSIALVAVSFINRLVQATYADSHDASRDRSAELVACGPVRFLLFGTLIASIRDNPNVKDFQEVPFSSLIAACLDNYCRHAAEDLSVVLCDAYDTLSVRGRRGRGKGSDGKEEQVLLQHVYKTHAEIDTYRLVCLRMQENVAITSAPPESSSALQQSHQQHTHRQKLQRSISNAPGKAMPSRTSMRRPAGAQYFDDEVSDFNALFASQGFTSGDAPLSSARYTDVSVAAPDTLPRRVCAYVARSWAEFVRLQTFDNAATIDRQARADVERLARAFADVGQALAATEGKGSAAALTQHTQAHQDNLAKLFIPVLESCALRSMTE
ncbi:hypothetical protein FVE85_5074 [Porphyridium purpureum]|uniref:Uncharacterized protein n=1 Tax=Porphyridium purpureum TaxID=35688 RepID=A0A5J4Z0S7_PORPP|nr:hypothetical protein FVE85_5074 [Porphyridium purpureum]|eukprot:POR3380..scf295_1